MKSDTFGCYDCPWYDETFGCLADMYDDCECHCGDTDEDIEEDTDLL